MQTFFIRAAALFENLLPLAEQPADARHSPRSTDDISGNLHDEDRLPARDESWYWAMHAHW